MYHRVSTSKHISGWKNVLKIHCVARITRRRTLKVSLSKNLVVIIQVIFKRWWKLSFQCGEWASGNNTSSCENIDRFLRRVLLRKTHWYSHCFFPETIGSHSSLVSLQLYYIDGKKNVTDDTWTISNCQKVTLCELIPMGRGRHY